jgi:hypothetical protein
VVGVAARFAAAAPRCCHASGNHCANASSPGFSRGREPLARGRLYRFCRPWNLSHVMGLPRRRRDCRRCQSCHAPCRNRSRLEWFPMIAFYPMHENPPLTHPHHMRPLLNVSREVLPKSRHGRQMPAPALNRDDPGPSKIRPVRGGLSRRPGSIRDRDRAGRRAGCDHP